jgi:ABC-type Mn2+/Zn2+ transport system ATPase subunit
LTVVRDRREVLSDVTMSLDAGRNIALVGPNGGGKTTLLRAILGWLPARGVIRIAGLPPEQARRQGNVVGFVPQRPAAPAGLPVSAREAVSLAAAPGREGRLWSEALLARVCGESGTDLLDAPVNRLSGGQVQMIFLARALAPGPRLLLLDEPTVGLDRSAVDRLVDLLGWAGSELGTTSLIATHDHLVALRLTDEVAYLDRTLRYVGPADAIPQHLDCQLCHHA